MNYLQAILSCHYHPTTSIKGRDMRIFITSDTDCDGWILWLMIASAYGASTLDCNSTADVQQQTVLKASIMADSYSNIISWLLHFTLIWTDPVCNEIHPNTFPSFISVGPSATCRQQISISLNLVQSLAVLFLCWSLSLSNLLQISSLFSLHSH